MKLFRTLARAGVDPVPVMRGHNEFAGLVTWALAHEHAQLGSLSRAESPCD